MDRPTVELTYKVWDAKLAPSSSSSSSVRLGALEESGVDVGTFHFFMVINYFFDVFPPKFDFSIIFSMFYLPKFDLSIIFSMFLPPKFDLSIIFSMFFRPKFYFSIIFRFLNFPKLAKNHLESPKNDPKIQKNDQKSPFNSEIGPKRILKLYWDPSVFEPVLPTMQAKR